MSEQEVGLGPANRKKIETLEERVAELEEENAEYEARFEELRKLIFEIDERTDLLKQVADVTKSSVEEGAAILVQRMHADASPDGRTTYEFGDAETLIGAGFNSRQPIYNRMQRAVELVDNVDVLWYEEYAKDNDRNNRLVMDLGNGSIPQSVLSVRSEGHATQTEEVSRGDNTVTPTTGLRGEK